MSDYDNLHKELGEIRELLVSKPKDPNLVDKYTKVIQTSLYILALILGAGVSWGMTSAKLSEVEHATQKVQVIEDRVHNLELRQAAETEILNSIKADLSDIKNELRKISRDKNG